MTSCPLLSFLALGAVSHVRCVHQTRHVPDAGKVQQVTVRQLCHETHVDSLFLEGFWRLVIDEAQLCTNPYDRMLAGTDDLLCQYVGWDGQVIGLDSQGRQRPSCPHAA